MYARRDQEVGLLAAQLPAARTRRAAHALRRQHRPRWRHGAVLRAFGHRQDDPLGRPGAPPHRRRRARLERPRRLQLRGRLLRQGDPSLGQGRAADLCAHVRFGSILENVVDRPWTRGHRLRRRRDHREHARHLSRRLHPRTRAAGHGRPSRATSCFSPATPSACCRRSPGSRRSRRCYHFLSGFTAKLAGTETGVTEPVPTFSACFGAPVHAAAARRCTPGLLAERLRVTHAPAGWSTRLERRTLRRRGRRMKIALTQAAGAGRALRAALANAASTP